MLFVNLYTGWWRTASWKRGTLPLHRGRRSGPLTAAKLTTLPPSEKFAIRYVQAHLRRFEPTTRAGVAQSVGAILTIGFSYHLLIGPLPRSTVPVGPHTRDRTSSTVVTFSLLLARIHRRTGMDGVRTAEGGEGVTGAMIRARIWVDGRLAGGLQALLGAPMAAYSGCGERDGGIGHGKRRSRTGLARVCGDVGLAGESVADGRRQAGSGRARNRARARSNWASQGQRCGRCSVRRRAERVIRPAREKNRRRRVLVVTTCSPRPMRAVQRARLWAITCTASQAALAAKRPEGRWFNPTPCLRSRMAFSISAWRRWSASSSSISPSRSVMKP